MASIAAPSTLLPFLYETRSLCRFPLFPRLTRHCFGPIVSPTRSFTHSTPISSHRIRRVQTGSPSRSRVSGNLNAQPTAGHPNSSEFVVRWTPVGENDSSHDLRRNSEQLEYVHDEPGSIGFSDRLDDHGQSQYSINNDTDPISFSSDFDPRMGESTITPKERQTFLRIFSDIRARSKVKSENLPARQGLFISPQVAMHRESAEQKMLSIMNRVSQRSEQSSEEEKLKAIEAFPQVLRGAAAEAMGMSEVEDRDEGDIEDEAIFLKKNAKTMILNEKRTAEYERIEAKMRAASTDDELWDIMELEVFSLVKKLGFAEEREKSKSKSRRHKGKQQSLEEDIEVYAPLYPSFLLLGFRLLERSFAKPSPLVDAIIPRIRSMGLMSHVLGASTALYNEQLRVMWYRNDDFLGVLNLLNEMEQAGLEFDNETLGIVNSIHRTQINTAVRGADGALLSSLWMLPQFAFGRFGDWRQKIQQSLDS